ncbi:hypothetical protein EX30DRAFT_206142 [Ascodesmis nigricans]|uniref:Uncharacterized protein n=1 Tax=Ascodesmis nigricans TaxID=341454 RepID=A0A4S2MK30_9PEZI|nr:hypothetical protein EX30DRAFT_206142 [Ascodesmis nigricans]
MRFSQRHLPCWLSVESVGFAGVGLSLGGSTMVAASGVGEPAGGGGNSGSWASLRCDTTLRRVDSTDTAAAASTQPCFSRCPDGRAGKVVKAVVMRSLPRAGRVVVHHIQPSSSYSIMLHHHRHSPSVHDQICPCRGGVRSGFRSSAIFRECCAADKTRTKQPWLSRSNRKRHNDDEGGTGIEGRQVHP